MKKHHLLELWSVAVLSKNTSSDDRIITDPTINHREDLEDAFDLLEKIYNSYQQTVSILSKEDQRVIEYNFVNLYNHLTVLSQSLPKEKAE